MTIVLDPGHGMSNRRAGVHDPGTVHKDGKTLVRECDVAMTWANELRIILLEAGHKVVRTRVDEKDPAPVGKRAGIARQYGGDVMLSIHCNSGGGTGVEVYYRGAKHRSKAAAISSEVAKALGLRDRGAKTEVASQHALLAVMAFQPCFLLEVGFMDNATDRAAFLDSSKRAAACKRIAELLAA